MDATTRTANATKASTATAVADVRRVPLTELIGTTGDSPRRIVPPPAASRVPVAAFNSAI